jgi:uncharacterized protein (DUF1800 family)
MAACSGKNVPRYNSLFATVLFSCFCAPTASFGLDANSNGLNDIWELVYSAGGLTGIGDADGDGVTNGSESDAGTNPFDPQSRPLLLATPGTPGHLQLSWNRVAGKRYRIESKATLQLPAWAPELTEVAARTDAAAYAFPTNAAAGFFRLSIGDVDTDADGLLDAEERWLGFDPSTNHTGRADAVDLDRVTEGLAATSTVTLGVVDPRLSERWPDPAVVVVRRSGGFAPLAVNVAFTGTAVRDFDYTAAIAGTTVQIPAGVREVPVALHPMADANDAEPPESIVVTLQPGAGYSLGSANAATITLENETATGLPSAKAAARFLIQAVFGPDQDSSADPDEIPENVEELMAIGFNAWIDNQFTRPIGYLQPWVDWAAVHANGLQLYGNAKEHAWWNRAMGVPKLRPDDTATVTPDPLRQRVAFALSEILVVSDRPEQLATEQRGMANYYDVLVRHAFGNFRDLLYDVAMHPVMGFYLSHVGNQKANPTQRIYPDENFAREIMQLFSIGLWKLNPDGTRQLNPQGNPIPTYDNGDITELARVFTGISYGNDASFALDPRDYLVPMKIWDEYHDCEPKTLLGGLQLPVRTPSPGNTGTAGLADVNAAIDNLFNHPNVGPFIGKLLIQRLVTSNPSPAYVGRVAAAFANNGSGLRGDMKAVIKAILLDPEARDPAMMNQPTWGKLREPFLRCVNFARAFNASSTSGWYPLDQFALDHLQDPLNSPSVFNFFLPAHSPPGPITQQGLVAPEFQILNASSAITGPNYFWGSILGDLHRWGAGNANYAVRPNINDELAFIVPAATIGQDVPAGPGLDPDPLLRRLDLALTGGALSPQQFQIIREAMLRVEPGGWQWHRERLRLAIYLIVTSAEFNVLR